MFGRSKESGDGSRVVKNEKKTTSDVLHYKRGRGEPTNPRGKYEVRCDEDGYSLPGLPKRDAEAFSDIHNTERHAR